MSDRDSRPASVESVCSPCVSICALDGDDVCVGCFRTGQEISHWGRLTVAQQRQVVSRCNVRMQGQVAACVVAEGQS